VKTAALVVFSLLAGVNAPLIAQTCSSTAATNELVCAVPQLFGAGGLTLPNTHHSAHFKNASLETFTPLNISIGEAFSTLPLGSAGSGVSFRFDENHVPIPMEDSLGPILTERAGVIGKHRMNLGVAFQYFSFSQVDGINLNHFPAVLGHAQFLVAGQKPDFENDYITTNNTVSLNLSQTVIYGVFGITGRMDGSIEIPIEKVHFRVTSAAHIVRTVPCEMTGTCNDKSSECGEYHYFDAGTNCSNALTSVDQTFTNGQDANGIGDVIVRAKYEVWKGERSGASLGLAYRIPSGDETNFLGSGAAGVEPFGAFTYHARLSPHVRLGYQWNGRSILAGDPTSTDPVAAKHHLPPELLYSAGADLRVARRVTAAVDLIGGRVLGANRLAPGTFTDVNGNVLPDLTSSLNDYSANAIGAGLKIRLARELVLIGNVTTRIDNGGLLAKVVPLVGLSYAF
jgi:hypothetical protein